QPLDQARSTHSNSTPNQAPLLTVRSVRLNPARTKPSTVQNSPFSSFSRQIIVAFAPLSTASPRDIGSFQRNPKGGNSSSAPRVVETTKSSRTDAIRTRDMLNQRRKQTLTTC